LIGHFKELVHSPHRRLPRIPRQRGTRVESKMKITSRSTSEMRHAKLPPRLISLQTALDDDIGPFHDSAEPSECEPLVHILRRPVGEACIRDNNSEPGRLMCALVLYRCLEPVVRVEPDHYPCLVVLVLLVKIDIERQFHVSASSLHAEERTIIVDKSVVGAGPEISARLWSDAKSGRTVLR